MVAAVAAVVVAATGAADAIDTDPRPPDRITHTNFFAPAARAPRGLLVCHPLGAIALYGRCAIMPGP
jgi:hypothetical protein